MNNIALRKVCTGTSALSVLPMLYIVSLRKREYSCEFVFSEQVLSAESQESAVLRDRVTEQEEVIADLEARVKERNDAWQNDRHKYITEIKHLRNEVSTVTLQSLRR